jgi:carboxyl-terminal processing protease
MRFRWIFLSAMVVGSLAGAGLLLMQSRPAGGEPAPVPGNRLFQSVVEFIRSQSVDSITDEELYRLAASGVVTELDDPYAILSLPGQPRSHFEDRDTPLGLYLERRDGAVVLIAAVPDSPADRAGVRSGDVLLGVGSTPVEPQNLELALELLEGPAGSMATLRLQRPGVGPLSLNVEREPVAAGPAISGSMLSAGVGVVRISRVPRGAADSVATAVDGLRESGMQSLVLDVRRAVGGQLADAVAIADLFLDSGTVILSTRGRTASDARQLIDSSPARFPDLPLVVLIDQGTAGAAEAVAGALQDHDRAAVLGSRSFGRGVTQRDFPLGSGASVRLTTAFWYTPNGRQIQLAEQNGAADSVPPPSVKSVAGRTLVGGGGIPPHQEVEAEPGADRPLDAARALLARARSPSGVLAQLDTR